MARRPRSSRYRTGGSSASIGATTGPAPSRRGGAQPTRPPLRTAPAARQGWGIDSRQIRRRVDKNVFQLGGAAEPKLRKEGFIGFRKETRQSFKDEKSAGETVDR